MMVIFIHQTEHLTWTPSFLWRQRDTQLI